MRRTLGRLRGKCTRVGTKWFSVGWRGKRKQSRGEWGKFLDFNRVEKNKDRADALAKTKRRK